MHVSRAELADLRRIQHLRAIVLPVADSAVGGVIFIHLWIAAPETYSQIVRVSSASDEGIALACISSNATEKSLIYLIPNIRIRSLPMKKLALCLITFISLLSGLRAQEIAGDWQAILHNKKDLHLILHIKKADTGSLKATLFSIDQTMGGMPVHPDRAKGIRSNLLFLRCSTSRTKVR
jgi:hypothetical protein